MELNDSNLSPLTPEAADDKQDALQTDDDVEGELEDTNQKSVALIESDDESEEDEDESDEDDDDDDEEEEADDGGEVDDNDDEEVDDNNDGEDEEGEDWETDDEDESESEEVEEEESDGEGESCPICLNRLKQQDIGTPESCDHIFCLECIQEWSKNVNTCPVDRQVFHLIFAKHPGEEKVFRRIVVEDKSQCEEEEDEEEDPTYCEICGRCDREDRLLLCDGCDLGYHCECLNPPLRQIPIEEWFCPECAEASNPDAGRISEVVDDSEEIRELIAENRTQPTYLRPRDEEPESGAGNRPRRRIARTRAFERVRSQINELRRQRQRRMTRSDFVIESSDEDELIQAAEETEMEAAAIVVGTQASSSTSKAPKKKTVAKKKTVKKRRKTSTKRKTTKKKTTKKKTKRKTKKTTSKTKKRSTKKRKTKKRKIPKHAKGLTKAKIAAATRLDIAPTTVKSRIAKNLGLSCPPVGRTIPLQKTKEKGNEGGRMESASSFTILGHKDDLYSFQDEEMPQASTSSESATSKTSRYSKSSLRSHKPVAKPRNYNLPSSKPVAGTSSSGTFDLLGSIMQDQKLLHMESKDITIQWDGSLKAKKKEETSHKSVENRPESKSSGLDTSQPELTHDNVMSDVKDGEKESVMDKNSEEECREEEDEMSDVSVNEKQAISDDDSDDIQEESSDDHEMQDEASHNIEDNSPTDTAEMVEAEVNTDAQSNCDTLEHSVRYLDREINTSICLEEVKRLSDCEEKVKEEKETDDEKSENEGDNILQKDKVEDTEGKEEEKQEDEKGNSDLDDNDNSEIKSLDKDSDANQDEDDLNDKGTNDSKGAHENDIEVSDEDNLNDKGTNDSKGVHENDIEVSIQRTTDDVLEDENVNSVGKDEESEEKQENEAEVEEKTNRKVKENYVSPFKNRKNKSRNTEKTKTDIQEEESEISEDWADMMNRARKTEPVKHSKRKRNSNSKSLSSENLDSSVTAKKGKEETETEESVKETSYDDDWENDSFKRTVMKDEDVIIVKVETAKKPLFSFDNKPSRVDKKDNKDNESGRREKEEKERDRGRDRDYKYEKLRDKEKESSSRSRHKKDRHRNRSRSRSRDKRDRSRSRDRSRRSRSRERRRYDRSRSRSWERERHHKKRRRDKSKERDRSRDRERDEKLRWSKSPGRRREKDLWYEKEIRYSAEDKRQKTREEKSEKTKSVDTYGSKRSHSSNEDEEIVIKKKTKHTKSVVQEAANLEVEKVKPKKVRKDSEKSEKIVKETQESEVISVTIVDDNEINSQGISVVTSDEKNKKSTNRENNVIPVVITNSPNNIEIVTSSQNVSSSNTEDSVKTKLMDSEKSLVIDYNHGALKSSDKNFENSFPGGVPPIPPEIKPDSYIKPPLPPPGSEGETAAIDHEYDPAYPTDDMEEPSPHPITPTEQVIFDAPPPPHMSFPPPHLLEENFQQQRLSPLPPHTGPPPGQGLLTDGTFLMPGGPEPLLPQPQHLQLHGLRVLPSGFQPGLQHQRHMIMNPMVLNRDPFSRFPRFPPGTHLPRFGIQVSATGGMLNMQNRFAPRLATAGLPGQPNLVNGGLELPPESAPPPPPPHFQHLLQGPNDPRVTTEPHSLLRPPGGPHDVRAPHHEPPGPQMPHPQTHPLMQERPLLQQRPLLQGPRSLIPDQNTIPPLLPEVLTEKLASVSMPQQRPDNAASHLEQITHITKLLNTQAQLAMYSSKEAQGQEDTVNDSDSRQKMSANDSSANDVFKVPLPPGKHKVHANNGKDIENENMEMVDMDMSSPLDDGNIEILDTENSDRKSVKRSPHKERKSRMKDSHERRHSRKENKEGKVRFKGDDSSKSRKPKDKSPVEKEYSTSEAMFDDMNDMASQDEIPSSAVELTNKEKVNTYLKKLHLQERVVDEVKVALKPFYNTKVVNKEQYKEILRKAVPKVCHSKSGDINPVKIKSLVEAYVDKYRRDVQHSSKHSKDSVKANGERAKSKGKSSR